MPSLMLDNIHQDAEALERTLAANETAVRRLAFQAGQRDIRRVILSGMGSSDTAAQMALPVYFNHFPLPVWAIASPDPLTYASPLVNEHTLLVLISRSGERGAVLDVLREATQRGAFCVAVTGSPNSLLAQESQYLLLTEEGPEKSFPKTKSVIATTGLLMQLGLAFAAPENLTAAGRQRSLRQMPEGVARSIAVCEPLIQSCIDQLARRENVAVCGSGGNWGVAVEGAMKLAEAAGISARYDTVLGLLVGPVMALNQRWLAIPLLTRQELQTGRQLLEVVRSVGAESLCIAEPGLHLQDVADRVLPLPHPVDPLLAPLTFLPPLQLLTYYWAVARGLNPDQPAQTEAILSALLPPGREEP